MADLSASLLTRTQREALAGESEPSRPREFKSRLRNRVYTGLKVDGPLLLELPREERRKLFREWEGGWESDELDELPGTRLMTRSMPVHGKNPETPEGKEKVEREELENGIIGLLAFLLVGIEEGNIGDTEEILEDAFSRAAWTTDRSLETFNLDVEMAGAHVRTPTDIAERVRRGDRDVTLSEAVLAIEKGELDPKNEDAQEILKTYKKLQDTVSSLSDRLENAEEDSG